MSRPLLAAFAVASTLGCSSQAPDARVTETLLPDRASFPYVAEVLVIHCGTLDCHGSLYRNLRIFGDEGLRYAPHDRPCIPPQTTPAEFDQDYASVVGLQPEVLNEVMAAHGADPERLDLLAKPLGLDAHQGKVLITKGDPTYDCITSWLASATDKAACVVAMTPPPSSAICQQQWSTLYDAGAP